MSGNDKPAEGKLGVLLPGMGADAPTVIEGVEAVRRGMAEPIGSWCRPSSAHRCP
jgi:myo-inositol-1-phosphate synthase